MKVFLQKIILINRAPFEKIELDFSENEIAILSAVNGRWKTTIISHVVDAFYEIAKKHYQNEFAWKENKFYRVSSAIHNLNQSVPSFVYLRFKSWEEYFDYVDIRNVCSEEEYNNNLLNIDNRIPFSEIQAELTNNKLTKKISSNLTKEKALLFFENNILTYYPAYRYEQPWYLNDPYKINLEFTKTSLFSWYLTNPIERVTWLSDFTNWLLDIVLDIAINEKWVDWIRSLTGNVLFLSLHKILSHVLQWKWFWPVRFWIWERSSGWARIGIYKDTTEWIRLIYPSIFNLSSWEASLLCLFWDILRQTDNLGIRTLIEWISGIVLIDEIDKHLHIKLQKEVLPVLLRMFPKIQFIISSHSPFLAMWLAEEVKERTKIIDLDNFWISNDPTINQQFLEVYEMMVWENQRFKALYDSISQEIEPSKKLQIVTEWANTEHIETAIQILRPDLLEKIKMVKWAESASWKQQLKNAYEIFSKWVHISKFLFIWDCDAIDIVNPIQESDSFFKFCFEKSTSNNKIKKWIENIYPESVFTDDLYDTNTTEIDYGWEKIEKKFNKIRFLEKIKSETGPDVFSWYEWLIEKIDNILQTDLSEWILASSLISSPTQP